MDQDLIAYLDTRFGEIDSRFRETSQQLNGLREELTVFREETNQRFQRIDERFERIDERFERIDERFERIEGRLGRVEEEARHSHILQEDLRGKVYLLVEGFSGLNERMNEYRKDIVTHAQFHEWMGPYYRDLNSRVTKLENWVEEHQQ